MQIIIVLNLFKEFFACKILLAANHLYPEKIQKIFRLQNCLRRNSSLSWKNSKTFSPVKLSERQIIIILKIFKYFFAGKIVLDENHHYPEIIQRFFCLQFVLAANHHYPENIQVVLCLQKCLRHKSSLSWKYSKTFSPAKLSSTPIILILKIFNIFFACKSVLDANHHYPEIFQRIFCLQICLSRKSSLSWNYLTTFPPAKLS